MITKEKYILCSAIHVRTDEICDHQPWNIYFGFVVCGRRHHNCFAIMKALDKNCREKYDKKCMIQGFITSDDEFVTRKEALEIAVNCGQLKKDDMISSTLTSEDLWR